jgi:hypothetical protein
MAVDHLQRVQLLHRFISNNNDTIKEGR